MTGDRKSRWSGLSRVGFWSVFLLVLAGFAFFGWRTGSAGAAVLSPENVAGFQTTEKLLIAVALANPDGKPVRGSLGVALVGPDGKVLAEQTRNLNEADETIGCSFEFPIQKSTDKLVLRCQLGKQQIEVPLHKVLVVKAHETSLSACQDFYAGANAALRCNVHGVKSLTENIPLAGADVEVRLRTKDDKVLPLRVTKTGADGSATIDFQVPAVPAGQYTLEIATKSGLGEEKLTHAVQIKSVPRILLVTDKPLYQPGQLIHIRALALNSFDLSPAAGKDLLFEVEDAKGNKVFKRTQPTSPFGVAAIDFQLADEVNMGDYHVRAILGEGADAAQADKTVAVKRYVLPKFKTDLKADKRYYLLKETIQADLQTDYFFGKPVSEGKVVVSASTFDVQFREFQKWEGTTDKNGHAKFEIKLPEYFVGQPLEKGNALVKLEVKVTDSADHAETIQRTYPVSAQPIKVSLIPEGGRLMPGLENRVFAAAVYPDGSPATCDVHLWFGQAAKDKPFATVKTNEAGLAEFKLTPKEDQLRQGEWEQRNIEMLGRTMPSGGPKILFDLFAEAQDGKGNKAHAAAEINCEPLGENILLRLDKAIYRGGDAVKIDIRSSAGLPTTYLDIIRGGQTLLTRWLDVKDGKAEYALNLPPGVFGTLEIHAYQMLSSGEIIRDSRVVYVQPATDLKIEVKTDKDVYLPGAEGKIRFSVTDAAGAPAQAALGIIIVDEAVYALQEMQPGLEKIYFTLQEELLKPQAQAVYRPSETVETLVREPELDAGKQQIAQVLLTAIKPKVPTRWEVVPAVERRQQAEEQIAQIGWVLYSYAADQQKPFMGYDKTAQRWEFKPGLLADLVKAQQLAPQSLNGPFGAKWTLDSLAQVEKDFTAGHLAEAVTRNRMQQLLWVVINYSNQRQAAFQKGGQWKFPASIVADAVKAQKLPDFWTKDAWGNPIQMVATEKKRNNPTGQPQLDFHELVSPGPDGKLGTEDDVKMLDPNVPQPPWWLTGRAGVIGQQARMKVRNGAFFGRGDRIRDGRFRALAANMAMPEAAAPAGAVQEFAAKKADNARRPDEKKAEAAPADDKGADPGQGGSAAPVRVREYFPETMLWQPALITDDKGRAELPVAFADSITTWRLSASASSKGGQLGGVSSPLRVFQDFFVDLDLPVSLTQNDEVAFPVAVYNYLKEPQTVTLELQPAEWFELIDGAPIRALALKPGDVTAVKYRIKAKKIGNQPLMVTARGSKMSDAIKRSVEVVPDGQKVEQVVSDRLTGRVAHTIQIPEHAVPDSYKLVVKVYPGIMSQVLEGTEGMLRLPGG